MTDAKPASKRRRILAQVERNIEDFSAHATHDFYFRVRWALIVQTAQSPALAIAGKTRLCNARLQPVGARFARAPNARERASRIFMLVHVEHVDARQLSLADDH